MSMRREDTTERTYNLFLVARGAASTRSSAGGLLAGERAETVHSTEEKRTRCAEWARRGSGEGRAV